MILKKLQAACKSLALLPFYANYEVNLLNDSVSNTTTTQFHTHYVF